MRIRRIYFQIIIIIFAFVTAIPNACCQEDQAGINTGNIRSAMMINDWIEVSDMAQITEVQARKILIKEMSDYLDLSSDEFDSMSTSDLTNWALLVSWTRNEDPGNRKCKKPTSLNTISDKAIEFLVKHNAVAIEHAESLNPLDLARLCYSYSLQQNHKAEIEALENIGASVPVHHLKDNLGNLMDVLKVMPSGKDYAYLGFYHTQVDQNKFQLKLAGSNDLKSWVFLRNLGDNDHQADVANLDNGFILVNEIDRTAEGNNLRIRYFDSYEQLLHGNSQLDAILPHTFDTPAEGTPSIRSIEGKAKSDHTLLLGFHYFNRATGADELAYGILSNLDPATWMVWRDDVATGNIRAMGYKGNIGTRSGFLEDALTLQEAQGSIGDWSSWDILLGNNFFYTKLELKTPERSVSFANPKISASLFPGKYIVTYFLPMNGNVISEIGTLLYLPKF